MHPSSPNSSQWGSQRSWRARLLRSASSAVGRSTFSAQRGVAGRRNSRRRPTSRWCLRRPRRAECRPRALARSRFVGILSLLPLRLFHLLSCVTSARVASAALAMLRTFSLSRAMRAILRVTVERRRFARASTRRQDEFVDPTAFVGEAAELRPQSIIYHCSSRR